MSAEDQLQERCIQHRKRMTRADDSRPFGYLRELVFAEFPNTRGDPFAFKKELGRIKRCLKRADASGGKDSKEKKAMAVERMRKVKKAQLRRRGAPGLDDYAPELHHQLFYWVVDTILNVKGRISSDILSVHLTMFSQDLRRYYQNEVGKGHMDASAIPRMPKLEAEAAMKSWIYRFRKKHHLAWNAVNLRLKCSLPKTYARVEAFFYNLYGVRWLHYFLNGNRQILRFEDSDEKPLWYTTADQERTLNFVGTKRKACVRENVPHTRKRLTFKSRCQYPTRLNDNKHGAILIKGSENLDRNQLQHQLDAPSGFLLQFAPKASYRLNQNLEYYHTHAYLSDKNRYPTSCVSYLSFQSGVRKGHVSLDHG